MNQSNLFCDACGGMAVQICVCSFPPKRLCTEHIATHMMKPSQVNHSFYPASIYSLMSGPEAVKAYKAKEARIDAVVYKLQECQEAAWREKEKLAAEFDAVISRIAGEKETALGRFDLEMKETVEAAEAFNQHLELLRTDPTYEPVNAFEAMAIRLPGSELETQLGKLVFVTVETQFERLGVTDCYRIVRGASVTPTQPTPTQPTPTQTREIQSPQQPQVSIFSFPAPELLPQLPQSQPSITLPLLPVLSSTALTVLNLQRSDQTRKLVFQHPLDNGEGSAWCMLQDGSVLCTGGTWHGNVYILGVAGTEMRTRLQNPRAYHALAFFYGRVFIFGGCFEHTKKALQSCEWADPPYMEWRPLPNMRKPRYCVCPAVCTETIVLVGGFDNSAEIYRVRTNSFDLVEFPTMIKQAICFPKGEDVYVLQGEKLFLLTTRNQVGITLTGTLSETTQMCSNVPVLFNQEWYFVDYSSKRIFKLNCTKKVLTKLYDIQKA